MEGQIHQASTPIEIADNNGNRYFVSSHYPADLTEGTLPKEISTIGEYTKFMANLPGKDKEHLVKSLAKSYHKTAETLICQGELKIFPIPKNHAAADHKAPKADDEIGITRGKAYSQSGYDGKSNALKQHEAGQQKISHLASGPTPPKTKLSNTQAKRTSNEDNKHSDKAATASTPCQGDPISMVSGEELLPLTDFVLPGPIPFRWERTYRTSNPGNLGLGHGWTHPLCERLTLEDGFVFYHTLEGRAVRFVQPNIGNSRRNRSEKMTLHRQSEHSYQIYQKHEPRRTFRADGISQHLPLAELRDDFSNSINIDYLNGKPNKLITSWGRTLEFRHDDQGHIVDIHSAHGSQDVPTLLSRYAYDEQNDLIEAQDQSGSSERYHYDNHIIVQRSTQAGVNFLFEWDQHTPDARCQRQWADNGAYNYRFKWQPKRKISYATDGNGKTRQYHFDENGKVVKEVDPEGGITKRLYDSYGHLCSETTPNAQTTYYRYDSLGNITRITDPLNQSTRIRYNSQGLPALITDALGNHWQRRYNAQGLLTETRDPVGNTWRYDYNERGQLETLTDPEGGKRQLEWNSQFELLSQTDPDGRKTEYSYDHWSRVNSVTDPAGQTTHYEYDNAGRITQVTDSKGDVTSLRYNEAGQVTHHTDASGRTTEYRYSGFSQVEERLDPNGQTFRYQYDQERNLIGLINEKGEQYQLKYDGNERLIEEIGFDGRQQQYRYDAAGHLIEHRDMDVITQFQRDPLGRLLRKSNNSGDVADFHYDALGRLTAANNQDAFVRFQYDASGRLVAEHCDNDVSYNSHSLNHQYDKRGWRIGTSSDDQHIRYQHTPGGQLYGVDHNGKPVIRCEYDQTGRLSQRTQGSLTSHYDYDPMGRLVQQRVNGQAKDDPVIQRDYKYNAAGNLAQIEDLLRGLTHYHYDGNDQLTQVDGAIKEAFDFDPAGNLLKSNDGEAQYDQGNQLRLHGDRHFSYDKRGNLIQENRGKQQSLQANYQYNGWNQLTSVEKDGFKTYYQYDALGRRIGKTVTHMKSKQQKKTTFLWNGDVLWSETNHTPKGTQSQHYLFEPNSFRPLALIKDDQIHHYHLDHLGTPQELTDACGTIVWQAQYKAYGQLAGFADKPGISNPLRFQGQYFDSETGLHYNRHRYYDPSVGRFIHQDPVGLLGGANNYRYAPNPVGWVDPFGLTCKETIVTYRGDGRSSATIFEEGFQAKGTALDLEVYASTNQPSAYVSTSKNPEVAIDFATVYGTKDGIIYSVRSANGIDVNKELGSKSPFPEEEEIAIQGGVKPEQILGATPVNADGSYVGYTTLNPKTY
ncbi:RHS repeat protein [Aestuariicella hydrocarbonica]|uniref:RHS repeat protein n=1 Tax=Pseudomaricurvus hydrocarbonicus TaxID=1470433 RepID=A0A9E5MM72_9GAMM|nr:RHS repeat-associated core domain-containing protein [Aestuariicella hydrocarbonica]NHO65615.1 RHS repeat protein [Aestuariicella hydrocarbonica]